MFEIFTTTSTTYTTDQPIEFTTPRFTDCRVDVNNGSTFVIQAPGIYVLKFNAVASGTTAAEPFTIQLYRNGVAVPAAVTTITSPAVGDEYTMTVDAFIRVLPSCASVNNTTALQWIVTSTDGGTVSSANFMIYRLK